MTTNTTTNTPTNMTTNTSTNPTTNTSTPPNTPPNPTTTPQNPSPSQTLSPTLFSTQVFSTEHELSFKITKRALGQLITDPTPNGLPILCPIQSLYITQKWIDSRTIGDTVMRTRIRKTEHLRPMDKDEYSYDTKYYIVNPNQFPNQLSNQPSNSNSNIQYNISTRIELNAPLTEQEYNILSDIHQEGVTIEKTRITLQDSQTGVVYTADIYNKKELVTIEIEFETKDDMEAFKKPQWLIDNEVNKEG